MTPYKTVKSAANDEFTEKKSRFIGYISPVCNEEEAVSFVNSIKKLHPSARHNVYAYTVRDGNITRYSDDGEPQGTGGIPILEVIKGNELCDCCIVVTRYFGGILLGTGGLSRAYSLGAQLAIKAGGIVKMQPCTVCVCNIEYNQYGILQNVLSAHSATVTDTEFNDNVNMEFYIASEMLNTLIADITEKTSGTVKTDIKEEKFLPVL